jgi:hypothetical protein
MATPIRWTTRVAAVLIIIAVVIAIDYVTDADLVGVTMRFALRAVTFVTASLVRSLQLLLRLVLRRRVWRLALGLLSIGLGYSWRVILTDKHARRADLYWAKMRSTIATMGVRWHVLPLAAKLSVVVVLVALQIVLFPTVSEYLVLFPIGFLIPMIVGGMRRMYGWIGDMLFGATYEMYVGKTHRKVVRTTRNLQLVRATRAAMRLARLRYLTAWRIWKYDPRYRKKTSELEVSLTEPIRLWKDKKLDRYVGRPLFSSHNK